MAASRRKRTAHGAGRSRRPRTWWVIAAVAIGLGLGGVAIIVSVIARSGDEDGSGGTDQTTVTAGHVCASGSVPVDGTACGQDSAPLTVAVYSDFLCPFCARAALETLPEIGEEYVAEGKVKLEFKHFVVHGEEAAVAAGAAECASKQNAFWEYHDLLFSNQGVVDFTVENLKQFAEELGLDSDSFNDCLDSERYMDKLSADIEEARERGVGGTPTFFVGQTQIVGAKPYSEFKTAIEDELARLGETE